MATQQQIQDAILLGRSYRFELVDDLLTNLKKGCCGNTSLIAQISGLISSLEHRIEDNIYNLTTNALYSCLLTSIANYSGASLTVDPNASLPNTIIEGGGGSGYNPPNPVNITFADMSGDDGSGGRTTYTNSGWVGWIPFLQTTGVIQLFDGVDYDYDVVTGTFTLLSDGNLPALYAGGIIRATSYASDGSNPPVNPLVPLFINWS
jgi:hypothetical protein